MSEMSGAEYDAYAQRHDFCCWLGMVAAQEQGTPGQSDCPTHGDSEFAQLARACSVAYQDAMSEVRARNERVLERARAHQMRFAKAWEQALGMAVGSEHEVDYPVRWPGDDA